MKDKNNKQSSSLSTRMVEPEATERLKKRFRDMGLIVNAGVGKADKTTDQKNGGKK